MTWTPDTVEALARELRETFKVEPGETLYTGHPKEVANRAASALTWALERIAKVEKDKQDAIKQRDQQYGRAEVAIEERDAANAQAEKAEEDFALLKSQTDEALRVLNERANYAEDIAADSRARAGSARNDVAKYLEERAGNKPCGCIVQTPDGIWMYNCDCGNYGDAGEASSWCISMNDAAALREEAAVGVTYEIDIPHIRKMFGYFGGDGDPPTDDDIRAIITAYQAGRALKEAGK